METDSRRGLNRGKGYSTRKENRIGWCTGSERRCATDKSGIITNTEAKISASRGKVTGLDGGR